MPDRLGRDRIQEAGRAGRDGENASCVVPKPNFDVLAERIERQFTDGKSPGGLSVGCESVQCVWRAT